MSEEISNMDERIAEVIKQKAEAEERKKQREAILANLPTEMLKTLEEATNESMVALQKLMKTEDELYRALEEAKESLLKKGYSGEDFKTAFADEQELMMKIRKRGGGFLKPPSGDEDKISKAVSLDEVEEWGTREENVWEFLESVKWDILVNNPDKFVAIKEIAKTLNWQFEGYAKFLHFLCLPLNLSPDIKIEEREDENHSLVAYKYKPDAKGTIQKQESYCTYRSFISMVEQEAMNWWDIYTVKGYYSCIKKVVEFFKEVKRNKENEKRDKIYDKIYGAMEELRRIQRMEWEARDDF